jgi:hypothetical protein
MEQISNGTDFNFEHFLDLNIFSNLNRFLNLNKFRILNSFRFEQNFEFEQIPNFNIFQILNMGFKICSLKDTHQQYV